MTEKECRDLLKGQVKKMALGPGFFEDVYAYTDLDHEILSGNPWDVYYTGILFPQNAVDVQDTSEEDELQVIQADAANQGGNDDCHEDDHSGDDLEDDGWQTKFFPNHIGLITCMGNVATKVNIGVSYAKYIRVDDPKEIKVKLQDVTRDRLDQLLGYYDQQQSVVNILERNGLEHFVDSIGFDDQNQAMYFKRNLVVGNDNDGGTHPLKLSDLPPLDDNHLYLAAAEGLVKNMIGTFYKRNPIEVDPIELDVSQEGTSEQDINEDIRLLLKVSGYQGKKYVKVIVRNRWSDNDRNIDKHLFQTKIRVESDNFVSYSEPISNIIDEENNLTEYTYRNVANYGKGVGLAIEWDRSNVAPEWVETTYMPESVVKDFSSSRDAITDYCKVFNMTIWSGLTDAQIIENLESFIQSYATWHEQQRQAGDGSGNANILLDRQESLLMRMRDNVAYLRANERAMVCFRIANTAMYMQMVVARDPRFGKNRSLTAVNQLGDIFNNIGFFSDPANVAEQPHYRPFQLAFLLMNVKSTFETSDPYRTDSVDLIWFQTGGGKTEAYLALTALTIAERRTCPDLNDEQKKGTAVVMRYTLRLLTAQQFERAAYLICALEFLRTQRGDLNLGQERITVGLWVGGAVTPNQPAGLGQPPYNNFFTDIRNGIVPLRNPFPIQYCPWCGCKLVQAGPAGPVLSGYDSRSGDLNCVNNQCYYNQYANNVTLPILYIDTPIYNNPPTLLFGTVDKFAALSEQEQGQLFGIYRGRGGAIEYRHMPPNLIIQDELHLINGPLGSMVGLYENFVQKMASHSGRTPKIIASTATTRNTKALVKSLYNKDVVTFPASGVGYDDNYFSHIQNSGRREHIGIMPTGKTSVMTEINLVAILTMAKVKLFVRELQDAGVNLSDEAAVYGHLTSNAQQQLNGMLDGFWTLVLYYNSLKDLGRAKSRISQEMRERVRYLSSKCVYLPKSLRFIIEGWDKRTIELTSRQDSSQIKAILDTASAPTALSWDANNNRIRINSHIDLVQATNMISVGIDIPRWNVMMMMGQPRSVSEYIQSSSRVARSCEGLVVNLMNPNRNREFSIFENYVSFHEMYYKFVEPLSATPFTEMTVKKLISNIAKGYILHIEGSNWTTANVAAYRTEIRDFLLAQCGNDAYMESYIEQELDVLCRQQGNTVKALREIDANCYIKMDQIPL